MFRLTGYEGDPNDIFTRADAEQQEAPPIPSYVKTLQGLWLFLLYPWGIFAGLSGLAFDDGPTTGAYIYVWAVWTYPLSVAIGWILKRRVPAAVLLPFANIFLLFVS